MEDGTIDADGMLVIGGQRFTAQQYREASLAIAQTFEAEEAEILAVVKSGVIEKESLLYGEGEQQFFEPFTTDPSLLTDEGVKYAVHKKWWFTHATQYEKNAFYKWLDSPKKSVGFPDGATVVDWLTNASTEIADQTAKKYGLVPITSSKDQKW